MDKLKRVFAMIGVVLLVFMYLMTIITAITASDGAHNWFIGSIMLTVFVPVILYAINMLINIQKRNEANNRMREEMYMRQIKDALKAKAEQEKAQKDAQMAAAQGQVQQGTQMTAAQGQVQQGTQMAAAQGQVQQGTQMTAAQGQMQQGTQMPAPQEKES